ncbi:MAG: hypothetical protein GX542_04070 [Rhodococcus sp.]|nr:hypothetical protein [Rhodococcus sp. (in: high G+C Gram-positive bacteria)]
MVTTPQPCPCGALNSYDACCGTFHSGAPAPTAEKLMRSRYSAFVVLASDYLLDTWHPDTRPRRLRLDPDDQWTGLTIISTTGGQLFDTEGTVEFTAHQRHHPPLHEISRFIRVDGRWMYLDGVHR